MPSSTSSSNSRIPDANYTKQWIITAITVILLATGLEYTLRQHGILPSVIDNKDLWAINRKKLDANDTSNQIVFLGLSRTQLGIDTQEIKKLKKYQSINLAIDGKQPPRTLQDIANNTTFSGTIIYSLMPSSITEKLYNAQESFVKHYHHNYKTWGAYEKPPITTLPLNSNTT